MIAAGDRCRVVICVLDCAQQSQKNYECKSSQAIIYITSVITRDMPDYERITSEARLTLRYYMITDQLLISDLSITRALS